MAKARNLPALDRARLEAINNRLIGINTPPQTRQAIMASLNAASNRQAETPQAGIASLPSERRTIAEQSVQDMAELFGFTQNVVVDFDEQMELQEALAKAEADGKDKLDWRLIVAIFLAYFLFPHEKEKSLYDSILSAYVAAWESAIKEQASRYGCNISRVGKPPLASMMQIREWAKRDSDSIVKTYDSEAQNALRRLYESNPLGTTAYYLNGMASWASSRQQHKNLTIGINNVQAGYQLGLQDFHIGNKLKTTYKFVGSVPVCPLCMRLFTMGFVDYETMASNGAPVHPNCGHWWESVNTYQIECATMWTGV